MGPIGSALPDVWVCTAYSMPLETISSSLNYPTREKPFGWPLSSAELPWELEEWKACILEWPGGLLWLRPICLQSKGLYGSNDDIFFSRLAKIFSQCDFFHGLFVSGTPRYLEGRLLLLKPRMVEIFFWTMMCVLKNKIEDFERFSSIPEALLKRLRILLYPKASLTDGVPCNIVSSTNCWWVVAGIEGRGWSPSITPSSLAFQISLLKPSIKFTKRKRDKGSPCRTPRKGENWVVGAPLTSIENLVDLTKARIQTIQCLAKPKALSITSR